MSEFMNEKLKEILSKCLGVPAVEIGNDFSSEHTESWDSLRHMNIILAIEDEYQLRFDAEEIPKMISLSIIDDIVQSKRSGQL